jgi:plasmid stabilization system protein ParE
MYKTIIWSPLAEKDFTNILLYLQEHWNEDVLENFIDITDELIEQIILNPKQFPIIHKTKKIRKCVLTKHNTLFYRIGNESVVIMRIYDNRQDPKKLKFK